MKTIAEVKSENRLITLVKTSGRYSIMVKVKVPPPTPECLEPDGRAELTIFFNSAETQSFIEQIKKES